ncbi:hypothetical protein AC579_6416 [Pseudocercospora musae]|uniref:Uncharacterized protein n=1 Tax=Pseudocercospora musae TaxID=113226 RepID=A0A139IJ67_9PEZI|nr:hypothetical protein AC579_6416 [Pseudocercospora musae]
MAVSSFASTHVRSEGERSDMILARHDLHFYVTFQRTVVSQDLESPRQTTSGRDASQIRSCDFRDISRHTRFKLFWSRDVDESPLETTYRLIEHLPTPRRDIELNVLKSKGLCRP